MRRNPRTGRKTVYLGHRVKDTRKPGLDTLTEVRGIALAIKRDYKNGRISRRKAMARLNLLTLIVKKTNKLSGKKRQAYKIIRQVKKQI